MMDDRQIMALVERVQAGKKYRSIAPGFVRRLSHDALERGLSGKSAVKAVRNKLHQVGNAYFRQNVDYAEKASILSEYQPDLYSDTVKKFCVNTMKAHASTAERLPILEDFYQTCLAPIAPVNSVLDLACGLNPLAIPWMPLSSGFRYHACDIYLDMVHFLQSFFDHFTLAASAEACDLIGEIPQPATQVAFLLKTIPCLEQVDRSIGQQILDKIPSEHILVSFPSQSLGGRQKGMPDFYREHFHELLAGKNWQVREFSFETELAFLVSR